jgi:hypothetical protein
VVCWVFGHCPSDSCPLGILPLIAVADIFPLISLKGADIFSLPVLKMLKYFIVCYKNSSHIVEIALCLNTQKLSRKFLKVKITSINKCTIIFPLAYKKSKHEMTSYNRKKGGQLYGANVIESALSDTKYYQHNNSFFNISSITDLFTLLLTNFTFSFFDYYFIGKSKIKCKIYIAFKQNVDKSLPCVVLK